MPPSPTTGGALRDELAVITPAGEFTIAFAVYCAANSIKLDAELTNQDAQNALVSLFRAGRTYEAWLAGSLGNAQYWSQPPDLGFGAGVPPPVAASADSLLTALMAKATVSPQEIMTALNDPKFTPLVSAVKGFLGGGGGAVGGATAVAAKP